MTQALYFDGVNDYLALGDLGTFEDKDGGFIGWLWLPDVVGDHVIFSEYDSAGACHVTLTVTDATLEAVAHDGTNTTTITGGTLSAETWHHVALVADATDLLLYVDGALVDSDTLPPLALTLDTTVLGRNEAGTDYLFGALSQARCYDSGPTAAEVLADYEAGDWPPDTDPVETRPLFDGDLTITVGGVDVTAVAMQARYSSTDPGGFGEASFRLPCTAPFGPYHASVVRGAAVTIVHDTTTLFEGTVTNDLDVGTVSDGEAYYDVAAAGKWYAAGLREDLCLMRCDTDFDQWEVGTRGQPSAYETDTDGRLAIVAARGSQYNSPGGGGLHYWLHKGLGDPDETIDHIIFVLGDYGDGNGRGLDLAVSSNWRFAIQTGAHPYDPAMSAHTVFSPPQQVAAGTIYRIPSAAGTSFGEGVQCVRARLYPVSDNTPSADKYWVCREMYVMMDPAYVAVTSITGTYPATVTTSAAHGLKVGDRVYIYGNSVATYCGIFTVLSVPTQTTFTIEAKGATTGSGGYLERLPSPVDAMRDIGEAIGGGSATVDDASYADALPGAVAIRPYASPAAAMDALAEQFDAPQSWGWWDSGNYAQKSIVIPATPDYVVDVTDPGTTYDVHTDEESQVEYVRVLHKLSSYVGLSGMRLSVTYTPSGGGAAVTVDCPITLDGRLRSAAASYATACAGGAAVDVEEDDGETLFVGQFKATSAPLYRLHEAFAEFDITDVAADAQSIDAVTLSTVARSQQLDGSSFTLRAYTFDFGATLEAADWRTPAQLAALTQVAGRSALDFIPGERVALGSLDAFKTAIATARAAGTTYRLVLASNRLQNATTPTGKEYLSLWSDEGDLQPDPLSGQVVQTAVSLTGDTPGHAIDSERVAVLDLSERSLTTADAQDEGKRYLTLLGSQAHHGSITVQAPTIDLYGGGTKLAAYVRAGEWVEETNAGTGPLRITTAEYDIDSSTLTMSIGEDPEEYRYLPDEAERTYLTPRRLPVARK